MAGATELAPRPAEPPGEETALSGGGRIGVGAAIGAALLFAILPAVVALFLESLIAVSCIGAEALEQTRGLEPATFHSGYRHAMILIFMMLGWAVVRRVRGWLGQTTPPAWRPLVVLTAFCVVGAGVLVPIDLSGAIDVPDTVTTTAILGCLDLWRYVLPLVVLRGVLTATTATWQYGVRSVASARRITTAAAVFTLSGASLGGATIYAASTGYLGDIGSLIDAPAAKAGFIESARREMADIALELTAPGVPDPQVATESGEARFQSCATALATPTEARNSAVDEATGILRRRFSMQPADAEDVAARVLLSVCQLHARRPVAGLRAYYLGAIIHRESKRFWRDGRRRREIFNGNALLRLPVPADDGPDPAELGAATAALSDLRDGDQQIIRLALFEEWPHREIANLLGISEAASARRHHESGCTTR